MSNKAVIKTSKNRYTISDDASRIVLEQTPAGTVLKELAALKGDNYLKSPTPLWGVEMTDSEHRHAALDAAGIVPSLSEENNCVRLCYAKVPIAEMKEAVNVEVTLTFNAEQQVEWRISVLTVLADWSVFRVSFPVFDLAVDESDDYTFIVPTDRGVAYRNPLKTIPMGGVIQKKRIRHRPYPSGHMTMQFLGLQRKSDLLYFAAHDPVPHLKTFYFEPNAADNVIHLHPYVDTLVQYGCDYHSFAWVTACTRGDWFTAAQLYRKFALTASWTQRGPLENGKTPRWYQDTPIVSCRLHRGAGYDVDDLIQEAEFFGLPMVTHFYMWHKNAFDADNPFFFPTVPGFRQAVAKLKEKQVHVMPYINPYSADISLPEWEQGLKNSAMQMSEQGDLSIQTWSQGRSFAGMCPASPLWRRLLNLLAMRMYEMGIKALYFDEVPVSSPRPCYRTDHNHTPGGGPTYVQSYYSYFKEIRDEAGDFCQDLIMTGEGCSEPYMLYLDAFLIGNGNDPQAVPLFEAVYHDYMMGYGRYTFTPELVSDRFKGAIISKHAQQFVWGSQFGWSRIPLTAIIQKDPGTANFLKHLAHVWVNNADYLARGKMLRPLDLSAQLKPVKRRWAMAWNDNEGTEVELMPVLNSVWQINDGSIAIVLTNITESPQQLTVKLPSAQQLLAQLMANGADAEATQKLDSSDVYPMPQNCIAIVRRQENEKQMTTICDGDTENGLKVQVLPLECLVLVIGSEKEYGVHH